MASLEWVENGREKDHLSFKAGDVRMAGVFYAGKLESLNGWDGITAKIEEKDQEKYPEKDHEKKWAEKQKMYSHRTDGSEHG